MLRLSDILSAEDPGTGIIPESGGGAVYQTFTTPSTDPLAPRPNASMFTATADAAAVADTKATVMAALDTVSVTGAKRTWWQKVTDFFEFTVPEKFAGAKTTVSGWFGSAPTSSAKVAGSTSSDSSWMLWVLGAGLLVGGYFAFAGKSGKKGGKSMFGKLGAKSSIKL